MHYLGNINPLEDISKNGLYLYSSSTPSLYPKAL